MWCVLLTSIASPRPPPPFTPRILSTQDEDLTLGAEEAMCVDKHDLDGDLFFICWNAELILLGSQHVAFDSIAGLPTSQARAYDCECVVSKFSEMIV